MIPLTLSESWWKIALKSFQDGIRVLNIADTDPEHARLAVVFLCATLEWATPDTWPRLYIETQLALKEARDIYMSFFT